MMARDFNGQLVLERFEENPFLPKFYEDPARYAFPLEMSFLADRYQQFLDLWTQPGLFSDITISDYFVIKSLIFAGVTLGEDEYELYRKIFRFMYRDLKKPDLYVYLYRQADDLIRNIARRGRDYEKNITADYLRKVHAAYLQFIRQQKDMPVLILDITGVDFVRDPWKYDEIVDEIVRRKDDPALVVTRQIMP
jgi:deoxyadenosine/deoxycytidine kinase